MYIIAGLGNPEKKYDGTRHNMGFRLADAIAEKYNFDYNLDKPHKGIIAKGSVSGEKVILAKPVTYMNLSGECLRALSDYYKVPPENVLVLYDDISMPPGKIRIRKKGSAGGHNGIKSIISHLGTENFPRIKFGVGEQPKGMDLADYVLGHFSKADELIIADSIDKVCEAVEVLLSEGIDSAMNKYNG